MYNAIEIRHIFTKHTLVKTHPYLCCIPNVQPVSLTGGHGGSGVNLQSVVWSSLIFTLPDTKAKLRVCLCVCCEWNAAYINRLNLTCQTLQTTLKHHGAQTATREGDRERERRGRRGGGVEGGWLLVPNDVASHGHSPPETCPPPL